MRDTKSRRLVMAVVCLLILCTLVILLPSLADAQDAKNPQQKPCVECVRVRVGLPRIARGPAVDIIDNHFNETRLPDGRFRGFDAHSETRAIDGNSPWDMGGQARTVLTRGAPDAYDSCGQWLNQVLPAANGATLGFIHAETACHYRSNFQTHMSIALAVSNDYGLTWKNYGQILTSMDQPTPSKQTGEGSISAVDGRDGYYYAYAFRNTDRGLIVARAPVSDPLPGNWMKFDQGKWDQPGLGGDATKLGDGTGIAVGRWATTGEIVMTGWVPGGLGLRFSSDHTTFTTLREPIVPLDPGGWKRPSPFEQFAYPSLLDLKTAGNQLSNKWLLAYAYVPPYENRDKRYLVFRDMAVSYSDKPVSPQVGVLLARWYSPALHDHWSTTAAVPGNYDMYQPESQSGYLMTMPPAGEPSVELEDCVSERPGHPDHILAEKGFCESRDYQRLRTAGWVYAKLQPGTVPLYRCYDSAEHSHFASNKPDCERLGTNEQLLGYVLEQ